MQRYFYQLNHPVFIFIIWLAAPMPWALSNNPCTEIKDIDLNESACLTCDAPEFIVVFNDGETRNILWPAVFPATSYELQIGPLGFTPGTGETELTIITSFISYSDALNLESGTNYEAYVRAICNIGDTSHFAGPAPFISPPVCGDVIYDLGGPNGNYPHRNMNLTICPDQPGQFAQLDFTAIDIEPCCANLGIYNGQFVENVPLNGALPAPFISRGSDGCLMLIFESFDDSQIGEGWEAHVSCLDCVPVNEIGLLRIEQEEVLFRWEPEVFHEKVNYEIGEAGFTPGNGEAVVEGSRAYPVNIVPVDGLTPGTAYEIYAWNDCAQSLSEPTGPIPFHTAPLCGGLFYDPGGPGGTFEMAIVPGTPPPPIIYTICPDVPIHPVGVSFIEFDLPSASYSLRIFDGESSTSPQIATLTGGQVPGSFISTHDSGCLTFEYRTFSSDPAVGWAAQIDCITCPPINEINLLDATQESAVIGWAPHANAQQYEWEMGLLGFIPGTGATLDSGIVSALSQSVQLDGLEKNTYYDFYIRIDCGNGDGSYFSDPFSFSSGLSCNDFYYDPGGPNESYANNLQTVTTICPTPPANQVTVGFNLFNLSSGDRITVFNHDQATGSSFGSFSGGVAPGPFVGSNPSGCLTFVFNSDGSSPGLGWEAQVACDGPTAVDESAENFSFDVFPNPAHASPRIQLESNFNTTLDLKVMDMTGQLILYKEVDVRAGKNNFELHTDEFSVGTYLILLETEEVIEAKRFVKY